MGITISNASLNHYNLYSVTWQGTTLNVLNILPDGQIVNSMMQYPLPDNYQFDIEISSLKNFLIVGSGDTISVFRVQSNGDLTISDQYTTAGAGWIQITPNEGLVVTGTYTSNIFLLNTAGQLIPSGNSIFPPGSLCRLNPRGNPLFISGGGYNWLQLDINYPLATVTQITTLTGGAGIRGVQWTPDGSLALVYGPSADPSSKYKVWVLGLDTSNRIIDTGQRLLYYTTWGIESWEIRFTPDSKYGFLAAGTTVLTLGINTITGQVTDTGIRSSLPISGAGDIMKLRITPDNRLLVVSHRSPVDHRVWLSTAFLNGDGSITWTGYTFPYDSTFAPGSLDTLRDMELLPIYVTNVDSTQWQLYE